MTSAVRDIVDRLCDPSYPPPPAGDTVLRLNAAEEIASLREALAPFAAFDDPKVWAPTPWSNKPDDAEVLFSHRTGKKITLGDFRRASAILRTAKVVSKV